MKPFKWATMSDAGGRSSSPVEMQNEALRIGRQVAKAKEVTQRPTRVDLSGHEMFAKVWPYLSPEEQDSFNRTATQAAIDEWMYLHEG